MMTWDLKGENLVGIGTDGANVVCGNHHSLTTLLKKDFPHLIHIKCICHSIDLIAKQAVKSSLPSNVDYMIRESFNWFSHSAIRLAAYQEIAKLVGFNTEVGEDGDDSDDPTEDIFGDRSPPRLISPSETRWLDMADCVEKILGQYDALKAHFQIAYCHEKCFQARTLYDMYKDEHNFLYLLLLHPILKELKRLSKLFQSNSADAFRVFADLESSFLSFGKRILKPVILRDNDINSLSQLNIDTDFCLLDPESVDLGSSFLNSLAKSSLTSSEKSDMKIRGKNFLKEIFCGFQKRMSGSIKMMHKIEHFSLEKFSSTSLSSEMFLSPFFTQTRTALSEIEEEAKLLKTVKLQESSTEAFWCTVHNNQDAAGNFPFRQLSSGVIRMLCLPISNAEVERVFSQVNLVKNCRRSGLKLDLLEAILHCKFGLSKFGKTVEDFKPPVSMLKYDSSIYE